MMTLVLILVNILMAWWHSRLLKKDRKIKHGWWGLAYILFASITTYYSEDVAVFINSLFIRKVFFDTALNLFRRLAIFYVSPEIERYSGLREAIKKGKVIDWLHYKLFGMHSEIYMSIYLMVVVVMTVWIAK